MSQAEYGGQDLARAVNVLLAIACLTERDAVLGIRRACGSGKAQRLANSERREVHIVFWRINYIAAQWAINAAVI